MVEDLAEAESFDSVYARERRKVEMIALRVLGERSAAEDVANETFLLFSKLEDQARQNAAAWLYCVAARRALNVARDRERRERREATVVRLDHATRGVGEDDPAIHYERDETRTRVRSVLARLPPRKAQILVLRYAGLSYQEVAAALGVATTSIGTLLARAEHFLSKGV
jgi:RNA polymerase sigma-70 factor (ECF subfamily)